MFKDNEQLLGQGTSRFENNQGLVGCVQEVILSPDKSLTEQGKIALSHELTPLTATGFMRDISLPDAYKVMFNDVFNHVIPCDRLLVYRKESKPVAFMSASFMVFEKKCVYHLEGIIVAPSMHGKGFSSGILIRDLSECRADMLTFHTQSRSMEILGYGVSNFDIDLARKIAGCVGTKNLVDLPSGPMDKGRYGGSLYGDLEKFDPIAIKRPGFNYLEGNAIVFAGRIIK